MPVRGVGSRRSRFSGGVPASLQSYSTAFPGTENPISQGGRWVNGATTGQTWNDVQTTPGLAFASAISLGVVDNIAHLNTSYHANQYVQGVAVRQPGYVPPNSHEIELLLRFQITANNARGYEILWSSDNTMAIVRWNGPVDSYTALLDNIPVPNAVTGDVVRAEIVGSTITVYKNGIVIGSASDPSPYTDGQPGIGFWPTSGATLNAYGWSSWAAGEL